MFWIEFVSNKECFNDMDIVGCPKNLNKEIRKLFFKEEGINIILTSATLTNNFVGSTEKNINI